MTGGIHVERASAERSQDALLLIEEYYEAIGVVARDDREAISHYLAEPRSAIWVAYADSAPAGCILIRPLQHFDQSAEIKRLYVRTAYRGRGLAALLLRALEEFAMHSGISWLYLDTKDDLRDAIAFYKRHGYTACDRYNDNPQATLFMRKQIRQATQMDRDSE